MDPFVWKGNFSIGVEEIDEQHKLFLEYVNECYNAVCKNHESRVTDATIYDLEVYAATHFLFEAELMMEIGYPHREEHVKQHGFFVSQVVGLKKAQSTQNKRTVESLVVFLRDWFLDHILEHDKRLAAFLKTRDLPKKPKGSRNRP